MQIGNHILYLTYDGLTDPLGQSQIVPYLNGLAEKGWTFWVISFEKVTKNPGLDGRITWIRLSYHKNPPVLSTIFDLLRMIRIASNIVRSNHIGVVHCRSYIPALAGLKLKKKYGLKFIFDMRGFWADERVEGGLWSLRNPLFRRIYHYFKQKEKEFISEADAINSLTESGREELLKNSKFEIRNSKLRDKITVISTCVNTELFDPERIQDSYKLKLRKSFGIKEGDFVLMYVGSAGTWYMMEEMIGFFHQLKKVRPNSWFVIVSNTQKQEDGNERIIWTHAERNEVPLFLFACDATICFVRPSYSKKASSATKIWESMAMGKPVIVNGGWGDIEKFAEDATRGLLITGTSKETMKIHELLTKTSTSNPERIRNFAVAHFALIDGIIKYQDIYKYLEEKIK